MGIINSSEELQHLVIPGWCPNSKGSSFSTATLLNWTKPHYPDIATEKLKEGPCAPALTKGSIMGFLLLWYMYGQWYILDLWLVGEPDPEELL